MSVSPSFPGRVCNPGQFRQMAALTHLDRVGPECATNALMINFPRMLYVDIPIKFFDVKYPSDHEFRYLPVIIYIYHSVHIYIFC